MKNQQTVSDQQTMMKQYEKLYTCPISLQLMKQPYVLPCQHTFQKMNILIHFIMNDTCPLCRAPCEYQDITVNILAKQAIQIYKNQLERKIYKEELQTNIKYLKLKELQTKLMQMIECVTNQNPKFLFINVNDFLCDIPDDLVKSIGQLSSFYTFLSNSKFRKDPDWCQIKIQNMLFKIKYKAQQYRIKLQAC